MLGARHLLRYHDSDRARTTVARVPHVSKEENRGSLHPSAPRAHCAGLRIRPVSRGVARQRPATSAANDGAVTAAPPVRAVPLADAGRRDAAGPELQDKTSVTRHTIRVGGQPIAYTATAGTLCSATTREAGCEFLLRVLRADNVPDLGNAGSSTRSMADLARRPSGCTWGSRGHGVWCTTTKASWCSRRSGCTTTNTRSSMSPTSSNRPGRDGLQHDGAGQDPHTFHGVADDIAAMADFIRVFTTRQSRWKSPKFLIGESYGTTRASGLAGYLQSQHQLYINGVILVSMTNLGVERGVDVSYATTLPYMTATAWYHRAVASRLAGQAAEGRAGRVRTVRDARLPGDAGQRRSCSRGRAGGGSKERGAVDRVSPEDSSSQATCGSSVAVLEGIDARLGAHRGPLDSRYTGIDKDAPAKFPKATRPCGPGTARLPAPSTPTSATS